MATGPSKPERTPLQKRNRKVALIAAGGFVLTGILMHLFVARAGLPYLPMQLVTTGVVMVFSFLGHKFFSFADRAA